MGDQATPALPESGAAHARERGLHLVQSAATGVETPGTPKAHGRLPLLPKLLQFLALLLAAGVLAREGHPTI